MKIKSLLFSLIVCLCAALFAFVGCGVYSDAVVPPGTNAGNDNNGGQDNPDNPDEPDTPAEDVFTVTVIIDGEYETDAQGNVTDEPKKYIQEGLTAVWRSVYTMQSAEFNDEGLATITGLDGEYSVTLGNLDSTYTYDTSIYNVDSDNRDVTITVYELDRLRTPSSNDGSSPDKPILITEEGQYRASIEGAGAEGRLYFSFSPKRSGTYVVKSWVDATANEVDPVFEEYGSVVHTLLQTVDGGASSNTFTSNFEYSFNISADMIGDSDQQRAEYLFAITATSRNNTYPVDVDFTVVFKDDYYRPSSGDVTIVLPEEDFETAQSIPSTAVAHMVYSDSWTDGSGSDSTRYRILDEDLVGLNEEDGYYHLLDESGEPNGPLQYAYITSISPIFAEVSGETDDRNQNYAIVDVELPGNNGLTIYTTDGLRKDFQLMLQGYTTAQSRGSGGLYDYTGYEDVHGYMEYVNNRGMYPVTEELKYFFQEYANSQNLFQDGNGWVEQQEYDGYNYEAYEDSMWLFCCAYFVVE